MFDITFFPARYGDSIWITYGTENKPRHILIDGGTGGTRSAIINKLKELEEAEQQLELVVVSHIDRDHIEGILSIFENHGNKVNTKDFWFNGWKHLVAVDGYIGLGAEQGEKLSSFLEEYETPWNEAFHQQAVCVGDDGKLPVIKLAGGAKITLLSPYKEQLVKLRGVWESEILREGLVPGSVPVELPVDDGGWTSLGDGSVNMDALLALKYGEDDAEANASSIAFIFEYEGVRVLLAADALPSVIANSLAQLPASSSVVDLFKLSHHGSRGNTSPDLFAQVAATNYVISTNGSIYKHPHPETIARLITSNDQAKTLFFNYKTQYNDIWNSDFLKDQYGYQTVYGDKEGITVQLSKG